MLNPFHAFYTGFEIFTLRHYFLPALGNLLFLCSFFVIELFSFMIFN
mgnify:CR=1 FL=1